MHVRRHTHTHTHAQTRESTHTHTHMHTHSHSHTHMHVRTCTHTHAHTRGAFLMLAQQCSAFIYHVQYECLIQSVLCHVCLGGLCGSMHLLHGHLSVTATGTEDSHFTMYHGSDNRWFSSDRVNVSSGGSAQTACPVTILVQVHGEWQLAWTRYVHSTFHHLHYKQNIRILCSMCTVLYTIYIYIYHILLLCWIMSMHNTCILCIYWVCECIAVYTYIVYFVHVMHVYLKLVKGYRFICALTVWMHLTPHWVALPFWTAMQVFACLSPLGFWFRWPFSLRHTWSNHLLTMEHGFR